VQIWKYHNETPLHKIYVQIRKFIHKIIKPSRTVISFSYLRICSPSWHLAGLALLGLTEAQLLLGDISTGLTYRHCRPWFRPAGQREAGWVTPTMYKVGWARHTQDGDPAGLDPCCLLPAKQHTQDSKPHLVLLPSTRLVKINIGSHPKPEMELEMSAAHIMYW
jgi:hypothetical protein